MDIKEWWGLNLIKAWYCGMQRYIVLIMELLGPGISDSMEIKARYYGMHWDIVGYNDGIYDKMADMLMAISCGPKICFVDRLIWRMYLPQHECWRGRKRNESLAPQPGGFHHLPCQKRTIVPLVSEDFMCFFYGYRKKVGHISNCKLIVIGFIFPFYHGFFQVWYGDVAAGWGRQIKTFWDFSGFSWRFAPETIQT